MAIVQSNSGSTVTTAATGTTATLGTGTTAGNTLLVGVSSNTTVPTPSGWTLDKSQVNSNGHYLFRKTAVGGETSWSFPNSSGTHHSAWWAIEASNLDTSTPLAATAISTGSSTAATTRSPGTSGTTSGATNGLAVFTTGTSNPSGGTSNVSSWSNSFTELTDTCSSHASATNLGCAVATLTPGSDTTYTSTATFSGSVRSTGILAIYKYGAPPPPGSPTVVAGYDRPVLTSGSVTLDVAATPPGGESITDYSWAITSGSGSLTNATTATPTYTAPSSGTSTATVTCTVTASGTGTANDSLVVGYSPVINAAENQLAGTARGTWDLASPNFAGVTTLQGFADGFTQDRGSAVSFKIAQSDADGWTAQVYRLGYYAGDGARLVDTLTPSGTQLTNSQAQPTPGDADSVTTLLSADCSNWTATLSWTPPSWAPSGIYFLRLVRTSGGSSHVMFILRDDSRTAKIMVMPSDSTWQAYNAFGGMGANLLAGNSLYLGTAVDQQDTDCARYVSYNRPIVNRAACNSGQAYGAVEWSTFFTGEYPMVRWLERNGYDVKYYGCIDAAADPTGAKLSNVTAAMFIGHNEYWTDNMRAGWEAAKAAGRNIFSCASNEVFWRVVGHDTDGSSRPRTLECYKSTISSRSSTGRTDWTGTWRDPDGAGKGGDNPELSFTGTIFAVNGPNLGSISVPFNGGYSAQPLWRNCSAVTSLTSGQSWTSPTEIRGFEWDTYGPAGCNTTGANFMGTVDARARYCSDTTVAVGTSLVLTDAGDQYSTGTVTHRLVVTPSSTGAGITFGTGTLNWALGLDSANTVQQGSDNTSVTIQQATVNILADMAVQPTTLMGTLTAATLTAWFATGTVAVTLGGPTATVVGTRTTGGTIAATLGKPTATVVGVRTTTGTVTATLGKPSATVVGTSAAPNVVTGTIAALLAGPLATLRQDTTLAVETGSWGPLLALVREARTTRSADPREAACCPNDGFVLLPDPRGGLRCPFDGYQRR